MTAVVTPVVAAACAVAVAVPISASSAPPTHRAAAATTAQRAKAPGHYTSRVVGSFGKAGTVRGSFVPLRSYVRNGKTVVQGNLVATLRRGNGALVGTVHRHDMVVPVNARGARQPHAAVAQAAASCTILHLVLGPLDLNLLGLTVHLNRVVLDITAVPGAGNLLGNLLCAVANLLNGPGSLLSTLRIGSLLSRIIGQIT